MAGPLGIALGIGYYLYFWAPTDSTRGMYGSGTGQTIGHQAMGLRVVSVDGSQLTIGQAIVRYIGYWVSAIPFGLGFLWVALDPDKQGWHDKMASTCVIRWSEPRAG